MIAHRVRLVCWAAIPLGLACALLSTALAAETQRGLLQLIVNQVAKGEIPVLLRPPDALVRVTDLTQAGLRVPEGTHETFQDETYVSLTSLTPGLTFTLDEDALTLSLTAQPELLAPTHIDLGSPRPAGLVYSRDASGFVNYSVRLRDFMQWDAFGEAGLSLHGKLLLLSGAAWTSPGQPVRGLTQLLLDDRERLTRWTVGDNVASTGGLGSNLLLGGLSVTREFGMDPYRVRGLERTLTGSTLTPSTVELYMNDVLLRRESLPPGPFELQNLPIPTGSQILRLVVRDAFGLEQETITPLYGVARLLRPGVHEFRYHLGLRREQLGTASWAYPYLRTAARGNAAQAGMLKPEAGESS